MFFRNSFAFSMIQWRLAIWSLVPLPFLKSNCTSGTSQFTYCWSLAWRILIITLLAYAVCLVAQLCPTLCEPMDCSPLGSSVHGILQARILEWVTIPFSRGSSGPRDLTQFSHIAGRFFTVWATGRNHAKECSNYCTTVLISHATKVMLKILQARLK